MRKLREPWPYCTTNFIKKFDIFFPFLYISGCSTRVCPVQCYVLLEFCNSMNFTFSSANDLVNTQKNKTKQTQKENKKISGIILCWNKLMKFYACQFISVAAVSTNHHHNPLRWPRNPNKQSNSNQSRTKISVLKTFATSKVFLAHHFPVYLCTADLR